MKQKFKKGTEEEMRKLEKEAKTAVELKKIQAVLLGSIGMKSKEISLIIGWHPDHIRKIWWKYRKKGKEFLLGEKRGKGRGKAHMTIKEEKELLKPFFKTAIEGKILEIGPIKKAFERKIGKEVQPSIIYKLLARHGWRKIMPRSNHPKADSKKQKKFKDEIFPPRDKKSSKRSR